MREILMTGSGQLEQVAPAPALHLNLGSPEFV